MRRFLILFIWFETECGADGPVSESSSGTLSSAAVGSERLRFGFDMMLGLGFIFYVIIYRGRREGGSGCRLRRDN